MSETNLQAGLVFSIQCFIKIIGLVKRRFQFTRPYSRESSHEIIFTVFEREEHSCYVIRFEKTHVCQS